MSKIPTAEEICNKQFFGFKGELWVGVHKAMVEFARLHVEAALKEANRKVIVTYYYDEGIRVNKDSILNAYPLTNIR